MKIGLALGGGGSKGAYQLGFFQAAHELNIPYQVITGASIGALNGAIMVNRDLDKLSNLWHNIELKKIMKHGINLDLDEILKSNKAELLTFIGSYIKNRGIDVTPLKKLIKDYIDVDGILNSPIKLGVTVATYPKMVGKDIIINETEPNLIADYLLASASCFPAFPVTKINDVGYIDGAYYDRLPIDLAFQLGADHVIAVDLHDQKFSHPHYLNYPKVTYIRSYHSLGPFMLVRSDIIARNIRLGYLDTMKTFSKYQGFKYTFKITSEFDDEAKAIVALIEKQEEYGLSELLDTYPLEVMSIRQRYLKYLEILAEAVDLDPLKIFDIRQMKDEIDRTIKENNKADEWLSKKPGEQHLMFKRMKPDASFGIIKKIALDKKQVSPETLEMLLDNFTTHYLLLLFYGLVK